MAEQSLGTLTLELGTLKKQIAEINSELGKIGVGVDFEKLMSDKISRALASLKEEAKKAGEEAAKAMTAGGGAEQAGQEFGKIASAIQKVTSETTNFMHSIDNSGQVVDQMVSRTVSGLDVFGNKIKEIYDQHGQLIRTSMTEIARETDTNTVLKQIIKNYQDLYSAKAQIEKLNHTQGSEEALARAKAEEAMIQQRINSMKELYPALDMVARENEKVISAKGNAEKQILDQLIAKYQEYYKLETDRVNAIHKGQTENADIYKARATAIWEEIKAMEARQPKIAQMAADDERLTKAVHGWQEAMNAATEKSNAFANQAETKAQRQELEELVGLYQKYYDYLSQGTKFMHQGDFASASQMFGKADEIYTQIEAISKLNEALDQEAQASDRVQAAKQKFTDTDQIAQNQEAAKNVQAYADALTNLYSAQAKFNTEVAAGRLKEGTAEYDAAKQKITDFEQAVVKAGEKLDQNGIKAAGSMDKVVAAADDLVRSQERLNAAGETDYLSRTQAAYQQLTTAIRNYNTAKKSGEDTLANYWEQQIQSVMNYATAVEQGLQSGQIEVSNKQELLSVLQQIRTAYTGINTEQKTASTGFFNWGQQFTSYVARMTSLLTIIRTIKNVVSSMVEYVSEYSDKMNEIQIITGKSDTQIDQLANKYRNMAKELSVSSKDIADAAVYFTRQGLGDSDIETRLKNVTKYAKTANVEFTQASEIMTSVINSMDLVSQEADDGRDAAQRVADVFLLIGDSAATSGQEIGEAMQKAAAAAGQFGVSFEWLASYIATVSETTRQEATTIGTAFNTIIARLHSIRTTGYNSEDEMKINDIQKALKNIDIALLDQEGNWRDMTTIFSEVAEKWDTLDDKTRSYIATTMAGVKQQNVFLALMSDLSKGIEGGSRAYELYEKAVNESLGTADQKYNTFMNSVAASKNKLEIAKENFYALMDDSVIKNWNNALADAISGITEFFKMMTQNDYDKYGEVLSSSLSRLDTAINRQKEYNKIIDELRFTSDGAATNIGDYYEALESIASVSPAASEALELMKSGAMDQAEAFRILAQEIQNAIDKEKEFSVSTMMKQLASWQGNTSLGGYMSKWNQNARLTTEGGASHFGANYSFAAQLKDAYDQRFYGKELISEEMFRFVHALVGQGVDWEQIGNLFWAEFGNGLTKSDPTSVMTQEVERTLDNVMEVIERSYNVDEITSGAIRRKMWNAVLGLDGTLSTEEYEAHTKTINAILNQLLGGLNPEDIVSDFDLANTIAESMFDKSAFDGLFESEGASFAQEFVNGYKELIKSGFSKDEIKGLMEESGIFSWNEILDQAKSHLIAYFGDMLEKEDLIGWNEAWGQLDLTMLRTIKNMVDAGADIHEIDDQLYNSRSIEEFTENVAELGNTMSETGEQTEDGAEKTTKSMQDILSEFDKYSKEIELVQKMKKTLQEGGTIADIGSEIMSFAETHPAIMAYISDLETLTAYLNRMDKGLPGKQKMTLKDSLLNSEDVMELAKELEIADSLIESEATTIGEHLRSIAEDNPDETNAISAWIDGIVNGLLRLKGAADDTAESMSVLIQQAAEAAQSSVEDSYASTTGYATQIDQLMTAMTEGGGAKAVEVFGSFNETIRQGIINEYPGLIQALSDISKATAEGADNADDLERATNKMNRELSKAKSMSNAKYFKDTWKAISDLSKGTISAADAYDKFYNEVDKVTKAQEEIRKTQDKVNEGTELTVSDVNDLAGVLGITAQKVLDDFPGAIDLFNEMLAAGQETFDALNREATMRILGIGDADFSALMSGMMAVQNTASSTVQALLALGQFELDTEELEENADFPILNADGKGVHIEHAKAGAKYTFLKPTGSNPFGASLSGGGGGGGGSGGGGGGGGGGGNKNKNSMTEVERMLDRMSQANDIQNSQLEYYQAQSSYKESQGYLQGVIKYAEKQIDVYNRQNKTLEENIAEIEKHIEEKKKELDALETTDESYEEVADDLDKLQKAHKEYTKQLVNNKTAVVNLKKEMKDLKKQIRDMEIEIKQEIYQAIEDTEERRKNKADAEIEIQDTILELIKARYEKEKEYLLEVADKKLSALEREKALLAEQLNIRKNMDASEEKSRKLIEYEEQYERISADPTRAKEANELRKKISDLRKEIAWDDAEQEIAAQQKSLDQQSEDLNNYKEKVEEYYEDLFANPKKMIEEMEDILSKTDEDIVKWLKKNSDEYKKSTKEMKKQVVDDWTEVLKARKGITKNHWAKVEEIYKQGDKAIINYLKKHSDEYRNAGDLQAKAYVEKWKEKLEDLKKALEDVKTKAAKVYDVVEKADSDGDGKSSGGGGGGGGGNTPKTTKKWHVSMDTTLSFDTEQDAKDYRSKKFKEYTDAYNRAKTTGDMAGVGEAYGLAQQWQSATISQYKKGGLVSETGLIQIDGSERLPERILSPYQTQLFETMVSALERASRISVPSFANFDGMETTGGTQNISMGDVIVNVEKLEEDADYEELARKVSEVLQDEMGKMVPVGGIRINA